MQFAQSEKIEKISAVDQVADKIQGHILSGNWSAGTKLPSESELASMYGVNRLTVRMALQKLNTLGLTETRVGSGTFVKTFRFTEHIQEISDLYATSDLLDGICEYRIAIEIESMRLAIDRATEEEFDHLRSLCEQYERYYRDNFELLTSLETSEAREKSLYKLALLDFDIHEYICKMAHNDLFWYAYSISRKTILEYLILINRQRHKTRAQALHHIHGQIYDAMKNKNFEKAKKLYLDMVDHNITLP